MMRSLTDSFLTLFCVETTPHAVAPFSIAYLSIQDLPASSLSTKGAFHVVMPGLDVIVLRFDSALAQDVDNSLVPTF